MARRGHAARARLFSRHGRETYRVAQSTRPSNVSASRAANAAAPAPRVRLYRGAIANTALIVIANRLTDRGLPFFSSPGAR